MEYPVYVSFVDSIGLRHFRIPGILSFNEDEQAYLPLHGVLP